MKILLLGLVWLLMMSCAERPVVDIDELVNYHTCTGLEQGAQWISWSEVSAARNLKYISDPPQAPPGRFLAVSNGEQPSGGYGFELSGIASDWFAPVLTFELLWHTPEPGDIATTLMTSPCIIFNINTLNHLEAVAVELDGKPFARLAEEF